MERSLKEVRSGISRRETSQLEVSSLSGRKKVDIIDKDGYKMIRRPRPKMLGQYKLEISAKDAEISGD